MRIALPLAAILALAVVLAGCGGSEDTHETLAGTPASIHVVKDVEAMAHACKHQTKKAHQAEGICQASTDAPVKLKVTGTVGYLDDDGQVIESVNAETQRAVYLAWCRAHDVPPSERILG